MTTPHDVLQYWFGDHATRPLAKQALWFGGGPKIDEEISQRFGAAVAQAGAGQLEGWKGTPEGRVAWTILLDQFSRNIHRDDGQAFANDHRTVASTLEAIAAGEDEAIPPVWRWFLYLPLMHAEDVQLQRRSVEMFEVLAATAEGEVAGAATHAALFARKHAAIIVRFGRFPHRNELLGRENTAEELAFLESEGRGF